MQNTLFGACGGLAAEFGLDWCSGLLIHKRGTSLPLFSSSCRCACVCMALNIREQNSPKWFCVVKWIQAKHEGCATYVGPAYASAHFVFFLNWRSCWCMKMKIKQILTFTVFHMHIIQTTTPENIVIILKQRQCLLGFPLAQTANNILYARSELGHDAHWTASSIRLYYIRIDEC